ncbi:hypothetical protein GOODEAATRI_034349 [Goodea atripinnis]|uniref:Uncharacterized protein n=1 Tax=Goodea atripinnis TaxID=208336 RepID=A0ABV0Q3E7_9TELE
MVGRSVGRKILLKLPLSAREHGSWTFTSKSADPSEVLVLAPAAQTPPPFPPPPASRCSASRYEVKKLWHVTLRAPSPRVRSSTTRIPKSFWGPWAPSGLPVYMLILHA